MELGMQDPFDTIMELVNVSNRMSLKAYCIISQRRYGYELVLDI